jgi:hypothetical protein
MAPAADGKATITTIDDAASTPTLAPIKPRARALLGRDHEKSAARNVEASCVLP